MGGHQPTEVTMSTEARRQHSIDKSDRLVIRLFGLGDAFAEGRFAIGAFVAVLLLVLLLWR